MPEMHGRVVPLAELTEEQRRQMYGVFSRYYDDVSYERFVGDLFEKDHVILLFDRNDVVQGFSTMKHLEVRRGGRVHRGLFSGDTVVAEEFWGQRVLGKLFLAHLFRQKLKNPFRAYWWFLISKGYKTYLLMANNFGEHYPRHEKSTPPEIQEALDAFAGELYPGDYDPRRGVIAFDEPHGKLRQEVAPITTDMLENPRIRFFQECNPGWRGGDELACLARMTWSMPVYYGAKAAWKKSARVGRMLTTRPWALEK